MLAARVNDDGKGQLVQFPESAIKNGRLMSTPMLLSRLDAAQDANDRVTAEALISALYERCDAAMVSKTREGGTP